MIWDTDYDGDGNCNKLINYLSRGGEVELYDSQGREMDEEERNQFVRESKDSEMERMITLSPEKEAGHAMSDDEMSLHARQTMNEYLKERPQASYSYAIHRDTDNPHVQVAVHGNYDSLKMYSNQDEDYTDEFEEMDEITESIWATRESQIKEQLADEQEANERETDAQTHSDGLSQSIGRGGV